jgi:hypothetical protein
MPDVMDGGQDVGIEYIEFPSRIIGGGTGVYEIQCDVTSCQFAEYMIVSISNGAVAGHGAVLINGNSRSAAANGLDYAATAGKSLNKDNSIKGMVFTLVASTSIFAPMTYWERITDPEKRVFVRIDAQASCSIYVSLRFRIAVLKTIPAPAVTVHHEQPEVLNAARADAVRQRLGLEKEIEQGEGLSAQRGPHMRSGMQSFLKGQQ